MKLVVQIPCFNEATTLPKVLSAIPHSINGVDTIEVIVVDDGSTDDTAAVAERMNVTRVVRHKTNLGLAASFRTGIEHALRAGADIIVNIDGDNQYTPGDMESLIRPILDGRADIVISDRCTSSINHFSFLKRALQSIGSFVVRRISETTVRDAVSGFRAFSRDAAFRLTVFGTYSYTLETIFQSSAKGLVIENVKSLTNQRERNSRLIKSTWTYLIISSGIIIRFAAIYRAARIFLLSGVTMTGAGAVLFVCDRLTAREEFAGVTPLFLMALIVTMLGVLLLVAASLADILQCNRRMLDEILERLRRGEYESRKRRGPEVGSDIEGRSP